MVLNNSISMVVLNGLGDVFQLVLHIALASTKLSLSAVIYCNGTTVHDLKASCYKNSNKVMQKSSCYVMLGLLPLAKRT